MVFPSSAYILKFVGQYGIKGIVEVGFSDHMQRLIDDLKNADIHVELIEKFEVRQLEKEGYINFGHCHPLAGLRRGAVNFQRKTGSGFSRDT